MMNGCTACYDRREHSWISRKKPRVPCRGRILPRWGPCATMSFQQERPLQYIDGYRVGLLFYTVEYYSSLSSVQYKAIYHESRWRILCSSYTVLYCTTTADLLKIELSEWWGGRMDAFAHTPHLQFVLQHILEQIKDKDSSRYG